MRFSGFVFACFSVVLAVSLLGCATVGGGQISGVNWALARNGGRVSVFTEEPDHPGSTLINGITSSDAWDQGEGWQAPINRSSSGHQSRSARRNEQQRNWVIIELSQPITVNNVRIYTIDSEKYPAREFGVSDLLVQYESETALKEKLWVSAERYGKGISDQDNIIRNNINGVIDVRFKPVHTQRIRVLIYGTNDMKVSKDNSGVKEGTIRLIEIEVYGSGKHKERDELESMLGK